MSLKIVPASILGVIIGTKLIEDQMVEDESEEYGQVWFGFIPNEKGVEVLPLELLNLLKKGEVNALFKSLSVRNNWSIEINHSSGGVSFIADDEGNEWFENVNFPEVKWANLFK